MPLAYRGNILNKRILIAFDISSRNNLLYFKTRKRVSSWLDVIFVFLYVIKSYYYRFPWYGNMQLRKDFLNITFSILSHSIPKLC